MRRLSLGLAVIAVALVATPARAGEARSANATTDQAERVAKRYVERRYHRRVREIFSYQSRMNRRWVLVTVFTARGTGIALWLKREDGRMRTKHSERAHDETRPPRSLRVPCDVQPAFSEPDC
jgi:hypothetical protein